MKKSVIITSSIGRKVNEFSLNLNNVDDFEELHLSMDHIMANGAKAIENRDYKRAKDYMLLADKINGDKLDDRIINFKLRVLLLEAISEIEVSEDIIEKIKVYIKLKNIDSRVRLSYDLNYDVKVEEALSLSSSNLKRVVEEVKNYIRNNERFNIEFLEALGETKIINNDNELIKKLENSRKEIEIKIFKLSNDSFIERLAFELGNKFEDKFYKSDEFKGILDFKDKLENYEALAQMTNKLYLLYKLNNKEDINLDNDLHGLLGYDYSMLPEVHRATVKRNVRQNNYRNIDEFNNAINSLIEEIRSMEKRNSLFI